MGRDARSFYLTTPIYYVNDAPHVGHAYTTVTADAIARYHRLAGFDTHFLTGTDEHGLKVQRAAEANGVTPQLWADQTVERFREAWRILDVSYDDFIRTTEPRHYHAVQELLRKVHENGHIRLDTYEGLYCVACEAYYSDAAAQGADCPIHGRPLEMVKEQNYFFALSRFQDQLLQWYESHPDFVQPQSKRNEALGFIRHGLEDFSISRTSLSWGVPIPWDAGHVTYVWFDALTNYITAAGYASDLAAFGRLWPVAHHMIGKDILRFHCVYWPAMLMAAGLEPPSKIYVHGYLLVGGEKMSKTKLNQISPADLVADLGVDAVRYYLLRGQPFGPDGDFSYEAIEERYNADLANGLGNLLSRVLTLVDRKCGGLAPGSGPGSRLANVAAQACADTMAGWESFQPSRALAATWDLVGATNAMLEDRQPWHLPPGEEIESVLGDALEALRVIAILVWPAMPAGAEQIWQRLALPGSPASAVLPRDAAWGSYPGGAKLARATPLFPRRTG